MPTNTVTFDKVTGSALPGLSQMPPVQSKKGNDFAETLKAQHTTMDDASDTVSDVSSTDSGVSSTEGDAVENNDARASVSDGPPSEGTTILGLPSVIRDMKLSAEENSGHVGGKGLPSSLISGSPAVVGINISKTSTGKPVVEAKAQMVGASLATLPDDSPVVMESLPRIRPAIESQGGQKGGQDGLPMMLPRQELTGVINNTTEMRNRLLASAKADNVFRDLLPGAMATSKESPLPVLPSAGSSLSGPQANGPMVLNLATHVQQPGWNQALGERVVWLSRQGVQEAQIQLTPRHLGPIEVRIMMNDDQASVVFTSQNPVTREALESAMPRLREMMADSGLNLVQSDVSQESPERRRQAMDDKQDSAHEHPTGDEAEILEQEMNSFISDPSQGILDLYA
ncbi:MAG: flagellar hook-length control protein FliK [Gammaproteobacteria bacterium]|nr:flagellar hook-length control protein FliK [Gammaproteobacteria bacterium]